MVSRSGVGHRSRLQTGASEGGCAVVAIRTVPVPGQVWGLAAPTGTGPVVLTSFLRADPARTVLIAFDLAGKVIWRREFGGLAGPPRVSTTGTVWVVDHDTTGTRLIELSMDGVVLGVVEPEHAAHEHLDVFALLEDGLCLGWLPGPVNREVPPGGAARLARYRANGDQLWSTRLVLDRLPLPGVLAAGVDTNWQVRPEKPWTPQTIRFGQPEPLLISGDRILAGLADYTSGIGVCILLDAHSGQIIALTEPAPYGHKAVVGPGQFLIGCQGYDAFSTTLYDRAGNAVRRWPSHAMLLVDHHGTIRGPESENLLPSRSVFRVFNSNGSLGGGPPLTGYYTTYPAIDEDGATVFWRDGHLQVIDMALRRRTLFTMDDQRAAMSRILLLDNGQVWFALDNDLLIVNGTGLAQLDPESGPAATATSKAIP
jgi:hypothetical protein